MGKPSVPYYLPPPPIQRRERTEEERAEWDRQVAQVLEIVQHRDFLAEARVLLGTVNSPRMVRMRAQRRVKRLTVTLGKILALRRESERLRAAGARAWEWTNPKVQADNSVVRFSVSVARARSLAAQGCDICAAWLERNAAELHEALGIKPTG